MSRSVVAGVRGAALPLAIFVLLVIGVLVSASLVVGRQELALGSATGRLHEALGAAEGGVQLRVGIWDRPRLNVLQAGDSVPFGGTLPTGGWYRGAVRRLNEPLFLVRAEGFSRDSGARQELGMLVRLEPIEIRRTAALVTQGLTEVRELARIDGTDGNPSAWGDCPASQGPAAGIHIPNGTDVSTTGCTSPPCVVGSPDVMADSALDGTGLSTFGDVGFDELRSRATVVLTGGARSAAPSQIGGICNAVDPDNWGSPTSPLGPCGRRFPVVWSEDSLVVTGGEGQGVLIVDGSLTMGGGFTFAGVILVRGRIATVGSGVSVHGVVVAIHASGGAHDIAGTSHIRYSACATRRALLLSALPGPLRTRGWFTVR